MPKRPGEPFTITRPRNKRRKVSSEPFTAVLHIQPWLAQDGDSGECEQTVELTIHEDFEFAYDELNTPNADLENDGVTEVEEERVDESGGDGESCEDEDWEQCWPAAREPSPDPDPEDDEVIEVDDNAGDGEGEGYEDENCRQPSLIVLHVSQEEQEGTRNNSRDARITTWRTRHLNYLFSEWEREQGSVEELQPDWEWFIGITNPPSDCGSEAGEAIETQEEQADEGEQADGVEESEGIEAGMLSTYGGKGRRGPITARRNAGGVHVDIPEPSHLTQQEGLDPPRQVWEDRTLEVLIVSLVIVIILTIRYLLAVFVD
ncbi:hypothetical protein F4782DRAFT_551841 [Xylaria castorea]|nr:hypothetical protein F4782DRAFT_551841 [Xylaria castorea]